MRTGSNPWRRSPTALGRRAACLACCLAAMSLRAREVEISEFLAAGGGSPLVDEDGDSSDWIELHNPGPAGVPLADHCLTDDPALPAKWRFPAVTVPAGGYLVVFASGKDRRDPARELHTNFRLEERGEYLALVKLLPEGAALLQDFAPGFPRQRQGISYGTARQELPSKLVAEGAPARILVPGDGGLGRSWTGDPAREPFDDSAAAGWVQGATGLGFDTGAGGPRPLGWWSFDDDSDPDLALDESGNEHHGTVTSHLALAGTGGGRKPVYTPDGGGRSGQPGDRALDFGPTASGGLVHIEGALRGAFDSATRQDAISLSLWVLGGPDQPADGIVFWGSSSPDGTGTRSLNAHVPWSDAVIYWDTAGCCDGTQRVSKPEPDSSRWKGRWNHYVFVKDGDRKRIWQNGALFHEGTNTANLTLVRGFFIGGSLNNGPWSYGGRIDDFAVWDSALSPVEIRSLAEGAPPVALASYTPLIRTDLRQAMLGRSASAYVRIPFAVESAVDFDSLLLRLRHDDGFIAYLNGVEVARRNAPGAAGFDAAALAPRPREQALQVEEIALDAQVGLLRPGANVLALHLLNASKDDPDLLLVPELIAARTAAGRYLPAPTPGAPNGPGLLGLVEDTSFSAGRGFYGEPVTVEITTATEGAEIHYSLDGSEPAPGKPGSRLYAGPLTVSSTTTLRAAAFKEGFHPTNVDTQSYIFPDGVRRQPRLPAGLPAQWSGGFPADYEVDPEVVNSARPGYGFEDALLAIPTVSIVLPREDLFGTAGGIYYHSSQVWERGASVELIDPSGSAGFQENAGVRIHGYTSRYHDFTPKHSFRVVFKSRFGVPKLDFPLIPGLAVREFNQFVLRGMSTDSWPVSDGWPGPGPEPLRWYREKAQYLREQWMKDSQVDMGQDSCHGRFVHLFLNGLYWGLYNLTERATDSFHAAHFGGRREEYDVLKDFAEVHSGDAQAWSQMIALAQAGLASDAAYQRLQGNNPDGTRNLAYPRYLDVDNLIDYIILHIYAGADDWPNHNWWAGRRRGPESEGFRFLSWDQEITNNSLGRTHTSWGTRFEEVSAYNSPAFLYAQLRASASFRLRFADRVHKHLQNDGALTPEANSARLLARAAEVDQAIVGESARWGDSKRTAPMKREVEWLREQRWLTDTYFPGVHPIALDRFRRVNLYPTVAAPVFSRHGGRISRGFELTMTAPAGSIYFTLDGSDPRARAGAASPAAQLYRGPVGLDGTATVKARALHQSLWSALNEALFTADVPLRLPGDLNGDSRLDLGDAVALLFALFLDSGVPLPCEGPLEGAANLKLLDLGGDARVDLADLVGLLSHLFLGGPPHVLGAACAPVEGCPDACER